MSDTLPFHEPTLDLCISAIYDQGQSVEDCLAQFPDERETLEPILLLTTRLQSARNLMAPNDFRVTARSRMEALLAETPPQAANSSTIGISATESGHAHPHRPHTSLWETSSPNPAQTNHRVRPLRRIPNRPSWAVAIGLLTILLLLVINSTAGYASHSLPGDPLYSIKQTVEQVQLAAAASPEAKANLHLKFAGQRYEEVKSLIVQNRAQSITQAVQLYQREITAAQASASSNQLNQQEKVQVVGHLANQLVQNGQELSTLLVDLPKNHPQLSAESASRVQTDVQGTIDIINQVYNHLLNDNPDLHEILPKFVLPTLATPDQPWQSVTPSPWSSPTPPPSSSQEVTQEGGKSEWPMPGSTVWPTPWSAEWATLVSEPYQTPPLPTQYRTLVSTYIPTNMSPDIIPTLVPQLPEILNTVIPVIKTEAAGGVSGEGDQETPPPGFWPGGGNGGDNDNPPPGFWPDDGGGSGGGGGHDTPPNWPP